MEQIFFNSSPSVPLKNPDKNSRGEVVLNPYSINPKAVTFMTIWATVWNIPVGFLVYRIIDDYITKSEVKISHVIFMIPFVIISLISVYLGLRLILMSLFVGKTEIIIDRNIVHPGDSVFAQLFHKKNSRLNSISVSLNACEITPRGEGSTDDKSYFYNTEIYSQVKVLGDKHRPIAQFVVSIPPDATPSSIENDLLVVWEFQVSIKLSIIPNVKVSIPICINPFNQQNNK